MRSLLLTFLIGFVALTAIYAGPLLLLPAVATVNLLYGRTLGFVALAAALAFCAATMWGLWKVADRRIGDLGPGSGRVPPDPWFCQRCGARAADAVVCVTCGATQFAPVPPAGVVHVAERGQRWRDHARSPLPPLVRALRIARTVAAGDVPRPRHIGPQRGSSQVRNTALEAVLPVIDRGTLTGIVRRALGSATVGIDNWQVHRFPIDQPQPVSGGVYRVSGVGHDGGQPVSWSVVLKGAQAPTGAAAEPDYLQPRGYGYWRREALVYTSGLLEHLGDGLAAPRCFGVDERPGATVWLWLEDVDGAAGQDWPLARYRLAARHLGRFNGAYLTDRPLPDVPWLCRTWPRGLVRRAAAPQAAAFLRQPSTWDHPLVRQAFPDRVAARLRRLWDERAVFLDALDRLPKTLCHREAYSRNLLARRDAHGREQTVALDWQTLGIGAIGEELCQLISLSLTRGDVAPGDAPRLADLVFEGYVEGLHDAGWRGDARLARLGATAAAAVWSSVRPAMHLEIMVDENRQAATERRYGRPIGRLVACWVAATHLYLDLADEARSLLPAT